MMTGKGTGRSDGRQDDWGGCLRAVCVCLEIKVIIFFLLSLEKVLFVPLKEEEEEEEDAVEV